mmetsp:Transcript_19303/g.39920  ORF Transcript_19303/g.39920 Transcript_19303/m.39920 type:complete len:120 (-) Transcript_19303:708-1067(-)
MRRKIDPDWTCDKLLRVGTVDESIAMFESSNTVSTGFWLRLIENERSQLGQGVLSPPAADSMYSTTQLRQKPDPQQELNIRSVGGSWQMSQSTEPLVTAGPFGASSLKRLFLLYTIKYG